MSDKIFKTYRQLLAILRNRGIIIDKGFSGSRVMRILEKENYYNVINGYKELFIDKPCTSVADEIYKKGTTFDEIYALYEFDRELRMIYLKYILKLENHFKTVVAHCFSEKYGYKNYLKMENFHCSASGNYGDLKKIAHKYHLDIKKDFAEIKKRSANENVSRVTKLIGDIQLEIARQLSKNHQAVTHYMSEHGYIPLWVLMNVLTFGKVTAFYHNLKETDKVVIAKQFHVSGSELHKYMSMLGLARNICAHDERFFDIRFRYKIHTKSIPNFSILGLSKDSGGSYIHGIGDSYAIAIIFRRLLPKSDVREFTSLMNSLFKKLDRQLHTIKLSDVQEKMGYPSSWKNLLQL